MDTVQELTQTSRKKKNLKVAAKISLVVLLLSVVGQLISVYQTRYELVSPLIPESIIWAITKQFIFIALVSAVCSIVGLILYFYEKYLWLIILVGLTLISERFIYIKNSADFYCHQHWVCQNGGGRKPCFNFLFFNLALYRAGRY